MRKQKRRTKKMKRRVVGEIRAVKGKHLARKPRGIVLEVCGDKIKPFDIYTLGSSRKWRRK